MRLLHEISSWQEQQQAAMQRQWSSRSAGAPRSHSSPQHRPSSRRRVASFAASCSSMQSPQATPRAATTACVAQVSREEGRRTAAKDLRERVRPEVADSDLACDVVADVARSCGYSSRREHGGNWKAAVALSSLAGNHSSHSIMEVVRSRHLVRVSSRALGHIWCSQGNPPDRPQSTAG
jgi:hypothetical protein